MKVLLAFILLFLWSIQPAQARVCEPESVCPPTVGCAMQTKKFSSYTAFDTWLQANKYANFEVVYASSTIVYILITSNDSSLVNQCWDRVGECIMQ